MRPVQPTPAPRWHARRGSALGAFIFAVTMAAVVSMAAVATMQIIRSNAAAEHSNVTLLAIGDRAQAALDDINNGTQAHRLLPAEQRITVDPPVNANGAGWKDINGQTCDPQDVCTRIDKVTVTRRAPITDPLHQQMATQITVTIMGQTPAAPNTTVRSRATRNIVFEQLPTNGVITGVDAEGRLQFVEAAGTASDPLNYGTDLWQILDRSLFN